MKFLLKLVVVLIVLLVVAAIGVYVYIDSIAKTAVERGATYALGVDTTVSGISLGLFGGEASIDDLQVNNPEGFQSDHFLTLNNADLAVSLGTLREQTIRAPRMHFEGIDLNLERKGGNGNYNVILNNLKRFQTDKPDAPPDDEDPRRFIVDDLDITNVKVHVDAFGTGPGISTLTVPIERVHLTNVGGDDGVPIAELAGIIVQALMKAVTDKAGDILPADMLNDLRGQLAQLQNLEAMGIGLMSEVGDLSQVKNLADDLKSKIGDDIDKTIGDAAGDIGNKARGAIDDATKGLGGLLGGNKSNDDPDNDPGADPDEPE